MKIFLDGLFFSRVDFSWEGGATLSQNSYKPSQDLWKVALQKRAIAVQWLARYFGTHRHTEILLLYMLRYFWFIMNLVLFRFIKVLNKKQGKCTFLESNFPHLIILFLVTFTKRTRMTKSIKAKLWNWTKGLSNIYTCRVTEIIPKIKCIG